MEVSAYEGVTGHRRCLPVQESAYGLWKVSTNGRFLPMTGVHL